jgi:cytochrome c oxidase cbb3-type subunit III
MSSRGGRTPGPSLWRRGHWTLLALILVLAAGCDLPGRPRAGDRFVPPDDERTFSVLFQKHCVGCHGSDGKLGPAPPLNDKLFLALVPDTELARVIAEGRAGTLMPAFARANGGELTELQVKVLAEGIKPRWGPAAPAPSGAPRYLIEPTQKSAGAASTREAGLAVFARACASCHGDHGQGGEMAGAINDPDFLALTSDQALRRFVITGRPDLGMPDHADPKGRPEGFKALNQDDVTNLTKLLADWRRQETAQRKGN